MCDIPYDAGVWLMIAGLALIAVAASLFIWAWMRK